MIQRIQTIFLLAALGLIISMFFINIGQLDKGITYSLSGYANIPKEYNQVNQPVLLKWISIFIAVLIFIIVFLYKNRKLQMYLSLFAIAILLLTNGLIYYNINATAAKLNAVVNFNLPILFLIIASVLVFLAYWNIRKDDNLIKSLDRLR